MSSRRRLSFRTGLECEQQQCELCSGCHVQLSHPTQWKSEQACALMTSLQVPLESLVCQPCRRDVNRLLTKPDFTPRWEKCKKRPACIADDCTDEVFVCTKVMDIQQLHLAIKTTGLVISDSENIPIPTPLCKTHYYYLYRSLQPSQTNCITCGTDLRNKVKLSRTCPRSDVIESPLRDNTGFEGQIKEHDKVCYSCYKFHTSIL